MNTWSGRPIPAGDRYGMLLLSRVLLGARAEAGRDLFSCYVAHTPAERQFWFDDYLACFPENRN